MILSVMIIDIEDLVLKYWYCDIFTNILEIIRFAIFKKHKMSNINNNINPYVLIILAFVTSNFITNLLDIVIFLITVIFQLTTIMILQLQYHPSL